MTDKNAMNRIQQLYGGYSEADAILLGQTPALMMPRFSSLPELTPGCRRYVIARDGLYVQARSRSLLLVLRVEKFQSPLPYGDLVESVQMVGGLIPYSLYAELRRQAVAACPDEWAAFVVYDGGYRIALPKVEAKSGSHISYRLGGIDEDKIVLDIHSHGKSDAFFSKDLDDRSDNHGIYFASVLGHCHKEESITCKSRIVIDGWHREINWHPWEDI